MAKMMQGKMEKGQYDIYPVGMEKKEHPLNDPYMARRRDLAYQMYELMGVGRKDGKGRMMAMSRNWQFFDAPVGIIFTLDKNMGPPQWSDVGMLMQSVMLLAREYGLHTCPQEAWSQFAPSVAKVCGIPDNEIVFSGMSLGYADESYEANGLYSSRAPLEEWASFQGFGGSKL
jgi:nitroreductase